MRTHLWKPSLFWSLIVSRKERVKAGRSLHLDLCGAGVGTLPLCPSKDRGFPEPGEMGTLCTLEALVFFLPFCCCCSSSHRFPDVFLRPPEETRGEGGSSCFRSFMSQHSPTHPAQLRLRHTEGGREGLGSQGAGAPGPQPVTARARELE